MITKIRWQGKVISIQPRIRLIRAFDERSHVYLGYILQLDGVVGGKERVFSVAIKKADQVGNSIQAGYTISGESALVKEKGLHAADFYKTTNMKVIDSSITKQDPQPPWGGLPKDMSVYRERGARRLDTNVYTESCATCIFGCMMAVEMSLDQWKKSLREYRQETYCFGPKSCALYKPGPRRIVPGKKGATWEEPDSVDDEATSHRGDDD